jgi:hypothetical protein
MPGFVVVHLAYLDDADMRRVSRSRYETVMAWAWK